MEISLYQVSVPVFLRGLGNLGHILEKGSAYAQARKIEPAILLQSRLFPDMHALTRQVQIATDTAKGCASRLAGLEPPRYDDHESTFEELLARIDKTTTLLNGVKPGQIDGSEQRTITLDVRDRTLTFSGLAYLLHHALPIFYFHLATAYDILRHNGVELDRWDFVGHS